MIPTRIGGGLMLIGGLVLLLFIAATDWPMVWDFNIDLVLFLLFVSGGMLAAGRWPESEQ